jgi:hypothetical protein
MDLKNDYLEVVIIPVKTPSGIEIPHPRFVTFYTVNGPEGMVGNKYLAEPGNLFAMIDKHYIKLDHVLGEVENETAVR